MNYRIKGVLLFLFIPLVLFMFVYYPFGIVPSFIPAIIIMVSHRFVAEPFMEHTHKERCLFCGKTHNSHEHEVAIQLKKGDMSFPACSEKHAARIRKFTAFVISHKRILAAGIFIPLVYYLLSMLVVGSGLVIKISDTSTFYTFNKIIFKGVIAVTVVLVSFLYMRGGDKTVGDFPFPIHNLALLGIGPTLWIFRIVGFIWIGQGVYTIKTFI